MKLLVIFFMAFIFLLTIFLGYFLSKNIIEKSELLIFWMLYLITIATVMTIFCSIYINYDIRNLKGPPGERGDKGDDGEIGDDGLCEDTCKDKIPYNTILNTIEKKLYDLENVNSKTIEPDLNNKELINELKNLKQFFKNSDSDTDKETQNINKIKSMYANIFGSNLEQSKIIKLENPFFKETIKRITQSDEYKQLEPVRGNKQLLEYMKYTFLIWVDLIYKQVGINYFKTIGAENDLERLENNPYNEIKKYDIYYWGYSSNYKPEINETKSLFTPKIEQFKNMSDLKKPKNTVTVKNPAKKLKVLRTNDYMDVYDDEGSYLKKTLHCFRPKTVKHKGETYYSMGDICVNKKQNINKKIFGNHTSSVSNKNSFEGPNRDALLVSGDVKKPIGYTQMWNDWQVYRADVHGKKPFGRNKPRYGHHKGNIYRLECPTGYTGMGIISASTKNVSDELKKYTESTSEKYTPKGIHTPVCITNDCVEKIDEDELKDFKQIWNTADSNKGYGKLFGVRKQKKPYKYLYNKTDTTNFVAANHSNVYNLSDMGEKIDDYKFYKIKDECITKEQAHPYYTKKHNLWNNKDGFSNTNNEDEKIIYLGGDDFQWPPLTKLDKTGEKDEDKLTMYVSVKEDRDTYLNKIKNSSLKKFIMDYNNKFYEKDSYNNAEITAIEKKINEIIININDYNKIDLQIVIGFFDSIPKTTKYEKIKTSLDNLHNLYVSKNGSKKEINGLGLGWIETKQKVLNNEDQSMHNFLYIDDNGIIEINSFNYLLFNKTSPGIFTLKKQNSTGNNIDYIYVNDSNKILSDKNYKNDSKYHFKIILSNGDEQSDKIYIKSLFNDHYLNYENNYILTKNKQLFTLKKI